MDFTITQGDLAPALTATLAYADGTQAQLAGATVTLILRNPEATAIALSGDCTVNGSQVTYTWQTGDTDTPGDYVGEFKVAFVDGVNQSFPTDGYFSLTIKPATTGDVKPRPTYLTTQDLIGQVRGYLEGRTRPGRNRLAAAISATDETIAFTYDISAAAPGMVLTLGLETLYVWGVSGNTLTVERGIEGTVPSAHTTGDIALISPEWTDARILTALNLELAALPSQGVYPVRSLDLTLTDDTTGYNLAADVVKVLDVRWQDQNDASRWTEIESFEVARNMPTTEFPSGIALLIPEQPRWGWCAGNTRALRVRYRSTFTALTTLFDDVLTVTGLPESAADIPALGAAIRLTAGRAVPRTNTTAQPDPRNSAEVRVSDVLNAPAFLRQQYAKRVEDEAAKLSSEWVWRAPTRTLMGSQPRRRRW